MRLGKPQFLSSHISSWAAPEQIATQLLGRSRPTNGHLCQAVQGAGDETPGKGVLPSVQYKGPSSPSAWKARAAEWSAPELMSLG